MATAQPTCSQVLAALNNACMQAAFGEDAKKSALTELRRLRNAKTAWIGSKELDLRREVDLHLAYYDA